MMINERKNYLDVLRILATIAVITIHVTGQHWMQLDVNSFSWIVYNFFRCISRWAVPIFIMISGALFLNPEKTLNFKKLFKKNIFRIITAYFFWSFIYAVYENDGNIISFMRKWLRGSGHMWFIYLILFLYIILPFTRLIIKNERMTNKVLIICFVVGFLIPFLLESVPTYFHKKLISGGFLFIVKVMQKLFGWIGYYCLGYKLTNTYLKDFKKFCVYTGGIVSFVSSFFLFWTYAKSFRYATNEFYDNISITVLLESVFIFLLIKSIKWNLSEKNSQVLQKISKMTFGIYMIHMLVYWNLDRFFYEFNINAFIQISFAIFMTFLISLIIVLVIDKIPVIRNYII